MSLPCVVAAGATSTAPAMALRLVNTLKEIPDTYTTPAYLATGRAGLKYQLSDRFSVHGETTYYIVAEPGEAFLWQQNDGTIYKQFSKKASFTVGLFYHFKE